MARKVCKKCKIFVEKNVCPICHGNQFSNSWKGRIAVINSENSEIAKHIGIKVKREYAIKVR